MVALSASGDPTPGIDPSDLHFGEYYYQHDCGTPYNRNDQWLGFFGHVAQNIVREVAPRTVLDVGCAKGFLVETLRDCDVAAWGVDPSEYAIGEVQESVRSYCAVSRADEDLPCGFPEAYDLVTCVEVLEHVADANLAGSVARICTWSDRILFSSSPHDYSEITHVNVHPSDYWAARFAEHGFVRDFDVDASFLTPWAVVFKRVPPTLPAVVRGYERAYEIALREARQARATALAVTSRLEVLETTDLAALRAEVDRLTSLLGPGEPGYVELRREAWRLRDEVAGLEAEAGNARGGLVAAQAAQASVDKRADLLALRLAEIRDQASNDINALLSSRQYRAGRYIVGPFRKIRRLLRGP